jgi:hypothetical protein
VIGHEEDAGLEKPEDILGIPHVEEDDEELNC